jgi:hypothetical protein
MSMSGNSALKAAPWTPRPPRDTASDTRKLLADDPEIILQRTKNVLLFRPSQKVLIEEPSIDELKSERTIFLNACIDKEALP